MLGNRSFFFSIFIKRMTEQTVALFHNTAWLNISVLDGANRLDMIDLLATKPRGYYSNPHNGFAAHSAAFFIWVSGHLWWLMDQWGCWIWQLVPGNNVMSCFSSSRGSGAPLRTPDLWIIDGDLYSHDAVNSLFVLERRNSSRSHRITNSNMPNFLQASDVLRRCLCISFASDRD